MAAGEAPTTSMPLLEEQTPYRHSKTQATRSKARKSLIQKEPALAMSRSSSSPASATACLRCLKPKQLPYLWLHNTTVRSSQLPAVRVSSSWSCVALPRTSQLWINMCLRKLEWVTTAMLLSGRCDSHSRKRIARAAQSSSGSLVSPQNTSLSSSIREKSTAGKSLDISEMLRRPSHVYFPQRSRHISRAMKGGMRPSGRWTGEGIPCRGPMQNMAVCNVLVRGETTTISTCERSFEMTSWRKSRA
mmetsp:Transcript_5330/g.14842  ORF Transcript_5330/g.14842 Transcript_5330/m.14842 type:complete len:246 (-) Transcript_5330:741-1478(-)